MKYCPVSKKCGGCAYIDVPYEEQLKMLEIKRQIESMQACMKKIVIVKYQVKCA